MAPKVSPSASAAGFFRAPKRCVPAACLGFLLVVLLAFSIQVFFFSPISPDLLPLRSLSSACLLPTNNYLQEATKLGEGFLEGPEDVCVDRNGAFYTATRDGWIKRMQKNGKWENWKKVSDGNTLLGVTITKENDVIVCDTERGLIKVSEDEVIVIASHVNGSEIRFADDVIEASDGSLYFSVASTKFGFQDWFLDFLEARPHGQLLKYDPLSNETSILLDNLGFANGVALSKDEDYLLVCESWKFRCLKYWLKGEANGKTEIFVENLPGGPDNINLAPDGSFWIAVLQMTKGLNFVHSSKALKHLIAAFPGLMKIINPMANNAMVVNVAENGNIIRKFEDPDGKAISFVTNAFEFDNHLYFGSLKSNFVGKLPLKAA